MVKEKGADFKGGEGAEGEGGENHGAGGDNNNVGGNKEGDKNGGESPSSPSPSPIPTMGRGTFEDRIIQAMDLMDTAIQIVCDSRDEIKNCGLLRNDAGAERAVEDLQHFIDNLTLHNEELVMLLDDPSRKKMTDWNKAVSETMDTHAGILVDVLETHSDIFVKRRTYISLEKMKTAQELFDYVIAIK